MERNNKLLWPKNQMKITAEELVRLVIGFPVALIKKLYPVIGREKTIEIVKETMKENLRELQKSPHNEGTEINSFYDIIAFLQGSTVQLTTQPVKYDALLFEKTRMFERNPQTGSIFAETKDNEVCVNVMKCLLADVFKELGAPEIGEIFACGYEVERLNCMNSRAKLKQDSCLMNGDRGCKLNYSWE